MGDAILKSFFDILKFYKNSDQALNLNQKLTLGEYLEINKLSKPFVNYHIIPMVSAIWSMPPVEASKMPIGFFLKFFQNHGLFKLKNRHNMDTLSEIHLGHKTISFKDIVGTGKKEINFSDVEIDKAKDYAAEDADITFIL